MFLFSSNSTKNCSNNSEYHSNSTTQRNQGNDHVIPITVFPPNSVLEIPSIMEDNPSYFSMECLIQVISINSDVFDFERKHKSNMNY